MEEVILVDEKNNEIGVAEKMDAHRKGVLHRAISVFILNSNNELLLQRRAVSKYHSGGLWTNTCCSHPRPGETALEAANRRLIEEMGMSCELKEIYQFQYRAELDNELTEHELDHVFVGYSDDSPILNPEEADAYRYERLEKITAHIEDAPTDYTEWFKITIDKFISEISGK